MTRINKFIALGTGLSRRAADAAIAQGRVRVNGELPQTGQDIQTTDTVTVDGNPVVAPIATQTILLNKPAGYVVSRDGQGSRTIYDLLPPAMHKLKPVGRLDKESSGLLLLTNDGPLAQQLTHPSYQKTKIYEVTLAKPLEPLHRQMIQDHGVLLDDGVSKFELARLHDGDDTAWRVTMQEGRNRQIRRTFSAVGYSITKLHRTHFGPYHLEPQVGPAKYITLPATATTSQEPSGRART
ncbi:MAG TPA: pseudouridine synthase [Patescibacteria group bacterium]|nr:pseudouridine synthase [Patescibacteria group bacterium]